MQIQGNSFSAFLGYLNINIRWTTFANFIWTENSLLPLELTYVVTVFFYIVPHGELKFSSQSLIVVLFFSRSNIFDAQQL